MNITTLNATIRTEKAKKTRKEGLIPAVIYGKDRQSTAIQFDNRDIIKVLQESGKRTRIQLKIGEEIKKGIIKDVAIDPVSSEVQHIDIQLVEKDDIVNWEIPITFSGREQLKSKGLLLQVNISQIKVSGRSVAIPDFVNVDVGDKKVNEEITIADLNLDAEIKTVKPSDTILANIKYAIANN